MAGNQTTSESTLRAIFAVIAGLVAFLLSLSMRGWGLFPSLIAGVIVGVLAYLLLWLLFRNGRDDVAYRATPAPAATATPVPPLATVAPVAPAAPAAPVAVASAPMASVAAKPQGLAAARGGKADDLRLIKGVGPKLEALLHRLGYFHFDQIAGWSASEIAWVDDNLEGFKGRVSRDNWVDQARQFAAGTTYSGKIN